ncbi:MAG: hypothetical protein QNJ91_18385, partial [Gammaproteobacteria bacterium]|nr:hypothetical protein [Gammaproteobacteria bacterium]
GRSSGSASLICGRLGMQRLDPGRIAIASSPHLPSDRVSPMTPATRPAPNAAPAADIAPHRPAPSAGVPGD